MPVLAALVTVALVHGQLDPNIIKWRTYKDGAYSRSQGPQIRVMETSGDFQRYLREFGPEGAGDGHDIDWGKEELIAIHLGARSTGGYKVEVTAVVKTKPNTATVFWSELTPVPGVATTQAVTNPWTIVRLNRPGLNLNFSGKKEAGRLPGGIKIVNFPGYPNRCTCCSNCVRDREDWLPYQVIAEGVDAPVLLGSTLVMNSAQDFANYCRNYNMPGLADGGRVDWDSERLVAIHLGRKLTPGYRILVDHVDIVDRQRVDVAYAQIEPTGQTYGPGTPRGPYVLVRIPRVGSLVTFSKRTVKDVDAYRGSACGCGCAACRCDR